MGGGNHRAKPANALQLQRAFGQRLRWVRKAWAEREPGLHSQQSWARALGVDRAAISRWESGKFPMPADLVYRVVMSAGVTWDFLHGGVIGSGLEPWLAAHLQARYPDAIVDQRAQREQQVAMLSSMQVHYSPPVPRPAHRAKKPGPRSSD